MPDLEIAAMAKLAEALEDLDHESISRVLRWASDKYKIASSAAGSKSGSGSATSGGVFSDFPDLYDAAGPETETDRALVAGYWIQESQNSTEWDSQTANSALKNLGHPVSNITKALDRLMESRPSLVMQTRKDGSSRQARKKYKLTLEGVRRVVEMTGRRGQRSADEPSS